MEEGNLPFVLMEFVREVLKVAFSEVCHVLLGKQALIDCLITLLLVLLDKDRLQQNPRRRIGSEVIITLSARCEIAESTG